MHDRLILPERGGEADLANLAVADPIVQAAGQTDHPIRLQARIDPGLVLFERHDHRGQVGRAGIPTHRTHLERTAYAERAHLHDPSELDLLPEVGDVDSSEERAHLDLVVLGSSTIRAHTQRSHDPESDADLDRRRRSDRCDLAGGRRAEDPGQDADRDFASGPSDGHSQRVLHDHLQVVWSGLVIIKAPRWCGHARQRQEVRCVLERPPEVVTRSVADRGKRPTNSGAH